MTNVGADVLLKKLAGKPVPQYVLYAPFILLNSSALKLEARLVRNIGRI